MKNYLQYGLVVVVVLMPFLSPIVLNPNPFDVLPENLKSVWGVVGVLLLFSGWLWLVLEEKLSIYLEVNSICRYLVCCSGHLSPYGGLMTSILH